MASGILDVLIRICLNRKRNQFFFPGEDLVHLEYRRRKNYERKQQKTEKKNMNATQTDIRVSELRARSRGLTLIFIARASKCIFHNSRIIISAVCDYACDVSATFFFFSALSPCLCVQQWQSAINSKTRANRVRVCKCVCMFSL